MASHSKLVTVSQPCDAAMGSNLLEVVAYTARVSNPDNQNNHLTSPKLIDYLIKNKHWSPFEMVSITIEVETTRAIARQLLRHRSFSFQEFSQRYSSDFCLVEDQELRIQDTKNRQNSIKEGVPEHLLKEWEEAKDVIASVVKSEYDYFIAMGMAKECVRAILPEGMTTSKLYVNGTLRSWIHYLQVRLDKSTQKEHRELALSILKTIEPVFPHINNVVSSD